MWTRLAFRASKLGIAIEPVMELDLDPDRTEVANWPESPLGEPLVPDEESLARLTLDSRFLGRQSRLTLWFDSETGEAFQREQVETGGKERRRVFRFARGGAGRFTWQPRRGESVDDPSSWSDRSDAWEAFPAQVGDRPVVETAALLYLLTRADLNETGEETRILAFSKGLVLEVTARVEGWVRERVDYRLAEGAGKRRIEGDRLLVLVSLSGHPVDKPPSRDDDETMELLGLHGDLEVLLDAELRLPVELRGRIPIFGRVRVRLREADLESGLATGAAAQPSQRKPSDRARKSGG